MTIIALQVGCGCTPLDSGGAGWSKWKKPPAVDSSTLALHQARLMEHAGAAAERSGDFDEAIRLYEQARSLDPAATHLPRRLAVLHDQKGDDARAQTAYEQAVAQSPDDPNLLNDIGMFHLARSRLAEAESWFRRALAVQPAHGRAANNLGIALAMQGRREESFAAFSTVAGPAAAYSNLGVVLLRQGSTDQAREHFRRALEHDPALHPAARLLADVEPPAGRPPDQAADTAIQPASYESLGR